jgi:hypothetical protein
MSVPVNATSLACAVLTSLLMAGSALAWGPPGHIIIGFAAAPLLCDAAAVQVEQLGGGESLARIGLWADDIRGEPQWRHAAPWHYVNIPDDGDPRQPSASSSGDVVAAIERFRREIANESLDKEDRAVALRFLVHFVGDLHQPLHVGRASDRGGNLIEVSYDDAATNLHAFWDSHVIRLSNRNIREYVAALASDVQILLEPERNKQVRDWVAQVFALREQIYDFDARTGRLDSGYLDKSVAIAESQLTLAAVHLANTLNEAFCPFG